FLGTGTSGGVPMVACSCPVCSSPNVFDKRLRSSLLVQSSTTTVVIDATPDFRQQMLTHGIKKLDAVVLTHAHKDHVGGLDDTRGFQYIQQQPTRIYGHAATLAGVKLELHYAFADRVYPGVPQIELITLTEEAFTIGDINFLPILVWHHKMPVHGYRIGSFTYITDANRIEDAELKKMEGSEVLVLNALRHEPHISHFSLQEAVAIARRLQVPQTYFTHISHQLGLHAQVNPSLPAGMALAYDGLVVCI
ncbi:MAG TPA: MBL fold metallo-hydrolase, partial [Phnomibacter sp.]|nr:MBL fold metallo-hydrolase [Phnomibacter sp.]